MMSPGLDHFRSCSRKLRVFLITAQGKVDFSFFGGTEAVSPEITNVLTSDSRIPISLLHQGDLVASHDVMEQTDLDVLTHLLSRRTPFLLPTVAETASCQFPLLYKHNLKDGKVPSPKLGFSAVLICLGCSSKIPQTG